VPEPRPLPPLSPAPLPPASATSASTRADAGAAGTDAAAPMERSRAGNEPIGSEGPIVVEAASPDGGWVVFCQAREDSDGNGAVSTTLEPGGELGGDRLDRYLAIGAGAGTRIESLAAWDPSGRWLVVSREGKLQLIDTTNGRETDLSALGVDARADALPYRRHRSLAFDGRGTKLAFLRGGPHPDVVVRELETGLDRHVDPGPGAVWRVDLDYSGSTLILSTLTDDTNHDQRLTWPVPEAKSAPPCRGPVARYAAWQGRGDRPVTKLGPATGGAAKRVDGFITVLGSALVVRDVNGRLSLVSNGKTSELFPPSCGGRVVHADAARQQLVVACTKGKGHPKLWLAGPGTKKDLDLGVSSWTEDRTAGPPARLVPLYPGRDSVLLDLERRETVALRAGDAVLATRDSRALYRRDRELLLRDVTADAEVELAGDLSSTESVTNGPWVAIAPVVANLETGTLSGRFQGRPLAVAPDGRVLVARGGDADGEHLALGPLTWQSPTLAHAGDAGTD